MRLLLPKNPLTSLIPQLEELRESLRRVAAECEPLERAQLAAAEAAKHDRRECARLRAASLRHSETAETAIGKCQELQARPGVSKHLAEL